ncbi:MAG: class I SAM-dependent methyltransferase [SAR202 cluster bacterium]|nr:class I SAM-dependent methyltransferase [SAR202 cluster bacterium]
MPSIKSDFYAAHARQYLRFVHDKVQSVYADSTHPDIASDSDMLKHLRGKIRPGSRGFDAGCGPGAPDVHEFWRHGFDIIGVDAEEHAINLTKEMFPATASRVSVADLREPLGYPDRVFDFVISKTVIQHLDPDSVKKVFLPEIARCMKLDGVLFNLFKTGTGVKTVYDADYGTDRTFQLYEPEEIVVMLDDLGLEVIPNTDDEPGGVITLVDPKPMEHCVIYARKVR